MIYMLPVGINMIRMLYPVGRPVTFSFVAYRTDWEYAERYSLVSGLILLFINVLIFYIYIRLADDLRIRRMNLVYEQQLDLCARSRHIPSQSCKPVQTLRS